MNSNRGMVTLMMVFSGLASLMCLLVGLQLLSLAAQIEQAAPGGLAEADLQFAQWRTQVHTGAIMSLGAGILVFLFGLRHHATAGKTDPGRVSGNGPDISAIDLESLSVRVFEVDAEDQSVEITAGDDPVPALEAEAPKIIWRPLDNNLDDPNQDQGPVGDPADSIVESIQDAVSPGPNQNQNPLRGRRSRNSFLNRLLRRRDPR